MIVITEVKYFEISRNDLAEHYQYPSMRPIYFANSDEVAPPKIVKETIRGAHFRRPDGTDVFVGFAADPAGVIGLSYEVFDKQAQTLERHWDDICALRRELASVKMKRDVTQSKIDAIVNASFLTRLKWLFRGAKCA